MTWLSKVRELEERLAEDCAAFDGQEASLVFVAESAKPESRIHFLKALKPLQHRSGMTMLARLSLPIRDQECHLVEVNVTGPDAARTSFAELSGKAGLLIPENVISSLDRFEPSKGKMTARGRFLALLWQLEFNRRIEAGDSAWMELEDAGGEFVFGIPDPFRLASLLLRCFRENPGGAFGLPVSKQTDRSNLIAVRSADKGTRLTIDQRMRLLLFENHESSGWTVSEFVAELKCSRGGVHKTATWQALESSRKFGKSERMKDRRAKTKRS